MSDISNTIINQYSYNAHAGAGLISQVTRVICLMLPHELIVAGFSNQGDLLMVRHSDYKKSITPWGLDFYEHQFSNELLLTNNEIVKHIFIGSDKYMVVPDELYNQGKAEKWLQQLYYVPTDEVISVHPLRKDQANYIYAWESAVKSLLTRYFPHAKVMPFAAYQFFKPYNKTDYSLQCCITAGQVYATLYKSRSIHWHQVFSYETAEDIAYHIKLLCKENGIPEDQLSVQCSVSNISLLAILNTLCEYFDIEKEGTTGPFNIDPSWGVTINMLQQLNACAS